MCVCVCLWVFLYKERQYAMKKNINCHPFRMGKFIVNLRNCAFLVLLSKCRFLRGNACYFWMILITFYYYKYAKGCWHAGDNHVQGILLNPFFLLINSYAYNAQVVIKWIKFRFKNSISIFLLFPCVNHITPVLYLSYR